VDIQHVARVARVSSATVSRVLNNSPKVKRSTFERVRKVIDELNYVPNTNARNLRVGRSQLFGLIVSEINNPFFPELIDDFEARARVSGIDVIFSHTNYQPDRLEHCLQRLIERNVDGIAVCTSETNSYAFDYAARRGCAFVLMDQEGIHTPFHNIYVDHDSGALEAVRHLYQLGHRRIGFIAGPSGYESTRARHRAYVAAMQACNLPVRDEWIVRGDLHTGGGHAAMEILLATRPRPTALLSTNDLMAFGALRAAHQRGITVPRELSIIGFDNIPVCEMVTPPLTSVDIPRREIASHAFRMLEKITTGEPKGKLPTPRVPTRLIVRNSTARPLRPAAKGK
jgi:DNA-binding LacI/PurR family transcriptional regulator